MNFSYKGFFCVKCAKGWEIIKDGFPFGWTRGTKKDAREFVDGISIGKSSITYTL